MGDVADAVNSGEHCSRCGARVLGADGVPAPGAGAPRLCGHCMNATARDLYQLSTVPKRRKRPR